MLIFQIRYYLADSTDFFRVRTHKSRHGAEAHLLETGYVYSEKADEWELKEDDKVVKAASIAVRRLFD